ncbi:uncharacterized protein LOC120353090 isoform X2 [Nilaparvata lugens]|uniref:uncharacterized protein LOC120353090 isoform X2 n=1 Tax=Nilaparvata lugens TaxID=108931 RepID=UPI00193D2558|nr:uncharacterized protein LOC120353090 isoform X2 [Nilaparvata lugens]
MRRSTHFLRKYIELLSYDKPHTSLPLFAFFVIFSLVNINLLKAIYIEFESFETSLNGLTDFAINSILLPCVIRHAFNKKEFTQLVDVIEKDLELDRIDFKGRKKLWTKIESTHRKRTYHAERMAQNLIALLTISGFSIYTKNLIKYIMLDKTKSENSDAIWPTPYLSYLPPEFDKLSFLIYLCFLHAFLLMIYVSEGILIFCSFNLTTEKLLADFEIFYILVDNLNRNFSYDYESQENIYSIYTPLMVDLRRDMRRIVCFHQNINRNFTICANNTAFGICIVNVALMSYGCTVAYFMLTNEVLRRTLAELPWTDKPYWFKQTLHVMMTRANMDIEIRPYGIYTPNYMSFKDLMKTAFSVSNLFYTKRTSTQ